MKFSNNLKRHLSKFQVATLSIFDNKQNSIVNVIEIKDSEIILDLSDTGTGSATLLFRNEFPNDNLYDCTLLQGKLNGNIFKPDFISGWNPRNQEFINWVQGTLPEGNKFLENYNNQLFSELMNTPFKGWLVSSVNGNIRSQMYDFTPCNNLIETIIEQNDIIATQIQVNPVVSILIDKPNYQKIVIYCDIVQKRIEEEKIYLSLKPMKFSHSSQSKMETMEIQSKSSILEDFKFSIKSIYNFTKISVNIQTIMSSIYPVLTGSIIAANSGFLLDYSGFIIIIFSLIFIQLGIGLILEYLNYRDGEVDIKLISTPISSTKFIHTGILTPQSTLLSGISMTLIALILGIFLNNSVPGNLPIYIGMLGAVIAYSYSGIPLKLNHKGLGELSMLIILGILPTIVTYYIHTLSNISPEIIFIGFSLGIFPTMQVILNNISDLEIDKETERKTLINRLGKKRGIRFYWLISFLNPILMVLFTGFGTLPSEFYFFGILFIVLPIRMNKSQFDARDEAIWVTKLQIITLFLIVIDFLAYALFS